jgi:hypothetical protein
MTAFQQEEGFGPGHFAEMAFRFMENARIEYQAGAGILDSIEAAFALHNAEIVVMVSTGLTTAGSVIGRTVGQFVGMPEQGAMVGEHLGRMAGEQYATGIVEGIRKVAHAVIPMLKTVVTVATTWFNKIFA